MIIVQGQYVHNSMPAPTEIMNWDQHIAAERQFPGVRISGVAPWNIWSCVIVVSSFCIFSYLLETLSENNQIDLVTKSDEKQRSVKPYERKCDDKVRQPRSAPGFFVETHFRLFTLFSLLIGQEPLQSLRAVKRLPPSRLCGPVFRLCQKISVFHCLFFQILVHAVLQRHCRISTVADADLMLHR